jgi:FkbM family methyltransferase
MILRLVNTVGSRMRRGYVALIVERRIPGAIQNVYFRCLNMMGIKTVNIKLKNGYLLTCLTQCYTIYVEVWQKRDYDFDDFEYEPGTTIMDIGANQGIFSLYAARNGAKVYAFEPCDENVEIMLRNIAQNNLNDNIHVAKCAVTGGGREVELFVGLDRHGDILSGSVSIVDDNRGGSGVVRRRANGVPANELFSFCDVDVCDFMKVDCEGAEYEIFDNITDETFQRIKRISVEFHHKGSAEIAERLSRAGFDIVRQDASETGVLKARNRRFGARLQSGSAAAALSAPAHRD